MPDQAMEEATSTSRQEAQEKFDRYMVVIDSKVRKFAKPSTHKSHFANLTEARDYYRSHLDSRNFQWPMVFSWKKAPKDPKRLTTRLVTALFKEGRMTLDSPPEDIAASAQPPQRRTTPSASNAQPTLAQRVREEPPQRTTPSASNAQPTLAPRLPSVRFGRNPMQLSKGRNTAKQSTGRVAATLPDTAITRWLSKGNTREDPVQQPKHHDPRRHEVIDSESDEALSDSESESESDNEFTNTADTDDIDTSESEPEPKQRHVPHAEARELRTARKRRVIDSDLEEVDAELGGAMQKRARTDITEKARATEPVTQTEPSSEKNKFLRGMRQSGIFGFQFNEGELCGAYGVNNHEGYVQLSDMLTMKNKKEGNEMEKAERALIMKGFSHQLAPRPGDPSKLK
ncbi:hypothetical protein CC80DRAFT_150515 [Byssothecium circinans]|uniref:Uncharacterized protein n=1 Tax=Byssothecium circinans TaxID=147558 RepID=A0A6A5TMH9_9PLEO|nr:hypothetical protein CC80DRAFT_150515 [Byssothecium circinans]